MPFAAPPSQDFGDGSNAGNSTELGNAKLNGANVDITGLGAATTAAFDGAKLKERIAEAQALATAHPERGFVLDVEDDPALAADVKTIAYTEPTGGAPALYTLKDAGVSKNLSGLTLEGLDLALGLLGF
jgi:hypothetical protein